MCLLLLSIHPSIDNQISSEYKSLMHAKNTPRRVV